MIKSIANKKVNLFLWDYQPGERSLWYCRYAIYRELGPNRTLETAWELSTGLDGRTLKPGATLPDAWREMAETWQWEKRARAYDQALVCRTLSTSVAMLTEYLPIEMTNDFCDFRTGEILPDADIWEIMRRYHGLNKLYNYIPEPED